MEKIKSLMVTICFILQSCSNADEIHNSQTDYTIPDEYSVSTPMDSKSAKDSYEGYDVQEKHTVSTPIGNVTYEYYDVTEEYNISTSMDNDTYEYYDVAEEYNVSTPMGHDFPVTKLTPEDIEEYLLQNDTLDFLSSFQPGYQRHVIRNQLKYCPYNSLCGFSFNLSDSISTCCIACSCDFPTCVKNKTCCPDILFNNVNKFNSTSVAQELPKLLEGQNVQKDCIYLSLSKFVSAAAKSAYGYSTCPIGTETELYKKCTQSYNAENISELIETVPVINRETNELYRNRFCAICNGVSIENVNGLDGRLKCKNSRYLTTDKEILQATYVDDRCNVQFSSEYELDDCFTSISDCGFYGTFEQTACSLFRSVIDIDGHFYQNIFCGICNKVLPKSVTCEISGRHGGQGYFPFSVLLKLNPIDNLNSRDGNNRDIDKCSEDQIYDKILDICKDMVCSEITVLKFGKCVELLQKQLESITYTAFLRIKAVNSLSIPDAYIVADSVITSMKDFLEGSILCGMQIIYKPNVPSNETDISVIESSNLLYFDARVRFDIFKSHNPNKFIAKIMKLHDSKHIFHLMNNSNKSVILKFQVRDDISEKFDAVDLLSQSNNDSETSSEGNDLIRSPYLIASNYGTRCAFIMQEFNIIEMTNCPKVKISAFDVPWKEVEDGITFLDRKSILESTEYYFVDEENIMVCADKYKQYLTQISHKNRDTSISVESIVSIVCSVVSILALCFTFFIYCFFSKLRVTIPGKNNMSLALALLFAQSLYLAGSFSGLERNSTECFIFGLLIHFSWLIALIWMNICTFHMFRVLARTKVMSHISGTRKLVIYHVYALFMATIFASINIGVSSVTNGDFGYGGETCYISSQRMVIYTFGIPAALVVLSNLFMFTFVIIKIKRSPSVQKNVRNERNDITVFAKLSTITGATWVFGFLYIWTSFTALSYMFIILNASQGIFIMFAFVVNRRVYDLFRGQVLGLTITSFGSEKSTSRTFFKMSNKS